MREDIKFDLVLTISTTSTNSDIFCSIRSISSFSFSSWIMWKVLWKYSAQGVACPRLNNKRTSIKNCRVMKRGRQHQIKAMAYPFQWDKYLYTACIRYMMKILQHTSTLHNVDRACCDHSSWWDWCIAGTFNRRSNYPASSSEITRKDYWGRDICVRPTFLYQNGYYKKHNDSMIRPRRSPAT